MKYSEEDILIDKEKRMRFQQGLINKFNMPLMVIRVNYPGVNRSNDITKNIMQNMDEIISDIFSCFIHFKVFRITAEGPILTIVINRNAKETKKTTIEIEDKHILGRCVEIDVYDKDMKKISRMDLGYPQKKCFLCDNSWEKCIKDTLHTKNEIVQYILGCYREYMESFYGKKI
ncbi:citrate lyase holo-[acyl-carrier protein] synthase [Clostridium ganghwense]|uniref:citrate lyase holo-[acyl-carrier protein] synthase n=1 Tax=Clostridium ganghwense TaxID=312089 RepID=A0ABT4CU69_9CLOT|nr:citrate lyase holo-[acyl-carrier protein] synthase [Clostridium ganghwense]MCY6371519.1 citrate lyase holo-[acyl-carrier protein] synthase [Clostridium ganghwense]